MYLKRLELQGFKSFANKTIFEFKPGITVVIGPNGSGKSNISDAIRWVLGEQSMKQLRGAKQEDIIFAGTQNRKSLGIAEVSIVFDNSDSKLPIDYNEVVITRRLYRTGETRYYINKNNCRLKDILELFMDTGIGKDGYSVIGQGKIDQILSTKSEDRRHIFEEASGIVKYRTRKEETEKKLEQTKLNLVRINDILSEIEMNLAPLEAQSKKAKEYLKLMDELKNIEVGLFIYEIEEARINLTQNEENKKIFENQSLEEDKTLNELQNKKENLKNEIDSLIAEIENLQNLSADSKTRIEKINSNISVSRERINNNEQNINRLESEIDTSNSKIDNLNSEKEERISKGENLEQDREKFQSELDSKIQELQSITSKLSEAEKENESNKRKIEELTDEKYDLQNQITENNANRNNIQESNKTELKKLDQIISNLDKNRIIQNDINQDFNKIKDLRKTKQDELSNLKSEMGEADKTRSNFEEEIKKLEDEYRSKSSKLNFLIETEKEKEGYQKAVKSILEEADKDNSFKSGMLGVLGDLISTDDKYQNAIEMALGNSMQNIVTEDENDAKRFVEFLRKNNIGRATFLPVSEIKGNKIEKTFSNENGFIGIASDLVSYESKLKNIIDNLLGRTIIVDNMESAIKFSRANGHQYRVVTLDGDIINPQGSITGGAIVKKSSSNILGRKHQIDKISKDIEKIKSNLEEEIAKRDKFVEDNKELIAKIDNMNNEISNFEIEYATNQEKVNNINLKMQELEKERDNIKNNISSNESKIEKLINEEKEINQKIEEKSNSINELMTKTKEFSKNNKADEEYIDDLNQDITNLKISLSSFDESKASMQEIIDRINSDISNEQKEVSNKQIQISKLKSNNEELSKLITDLAQNIEKIRKEVLGSADKLNSMKKVKESKNQELDFVEKEITSQFDKISQVKAEIIKIDSKSENIKQDITDITNELWENYELTPNTAKDYEVTQNVKETKKKVDKLHDVIRSLDDVNVQSIEEYQKTVDRYNNMNEQRLDLETSISKLRMVITEMTETMKTQFAEKFKLINKYFNEVFIELFGGGRAEIRLTDEENILESGIDIIAEPPGKKLQNMMLLSGGEKALTAIALLFAILKINPAPFCILDEIDAALDDVNVTRFADYLKKFSKNTQFLVITHRKGTMEAAEALYGITMEENGISKLLSIDLKR